MLHKEVARRIASKIHFGSAKRALKAIFTQVQAQREEPKKAGEAQQRRFETRRVPEEAKEPSRLRGQDPDSPDAARCERRPKRSDFESYPEIYQDQ